MLLLIALTSFFTIVLGVLSVAIRPPNTARERARALGGGEGTPVRRADAPFARRILRPLGRRTAGVLVGLLPNRWLHGLDRMLISAGEPLPVDVFVLLWVLTGAAAGFAGFALYGVAGMLLLGAAGICVPFLWLRGAASTRRMKIARALPDMIDLLVTCVESGLGLDASMVRVGESTDGPLGDEVKITMRQIAVGRPRQEALLDLGTRPGVRDLDGVIRPVVQAERSGVSIGNALRVQAEALRTRRRQRAQEAAQKMGVKLMLPVAVFFLPATLIVAVGPAAFSFIDFFSEV